MVFTMLKPLPSCAHLAAYPSMNSHVLKIIRGAISASHSLVEGEIPADGRTDLDSHANMCVLGRQAVAISESGRYAEVNAFSPDIEALQRVPIVDAGIAYDCPYSMQTYILVVCNALHIPSMDHNLIPPFIL